MKSTKKLFLQLISLVLGAFLFATTATAAPLDKKQLSASEAYNDMVIESMWKAGGKKYQKAVSELSYKYMEKMDGECKVSGVFDVSRALAAYRVHAPAGAEKMRIQMIRKQVATMACIMSAYHFSGDEIARKLKVWQM